MSRWAPSCLSSGTSGMLARACGAASRSLHCCSVRSFVAPIAGNNGCLHDVDQGQTGKQQQQLRPLCLQLSRFGLRYRHGLVRHYRAHCPSAASYWQQTRGGGIVGLATSAAAVGSTSARGQSPSAKAGSDEAATAASTQQQQQHNRQKPFEQIWIEARRRPQMQEQLKRDEAKFMRDVIKALPQYAPYIACRSVESDNSTRPGHHVEEAVASAIRSLESFASDRDRDCSSSAAAAGGGRSRSALAKSDWANAFQCLDAISRLDRGDQQRLILQPDVGTVGRPFAALLAFCCRNLQALPADDYRKLVRSLAGVKWELLPGKAGNQFLHSVEYAQLEERVANACGELLDRPTGSGSIGLPMSAARRTRGSSRRPAAEAAGVVSPATAPTSIGKLHLAYALMAEHARRMPSWSLVDVAFHSDVFNALLVASSDACLRTYYIATMAVIERLLLNGACADGGKAWVALPSKPSPTGATAAALPTVEVLVMTCYLAACCRHAPRSLMQLVEGAARQRWREMQPLERAVVALGFFKSQNKFASRQLVCGMFDTARVVASGAVRLPSSAVGDPTYVVSSLVKQCAYSVDRVQVAVHETLRTAMLRCYAAVVPDAPIATSVRCVQSMIVTRQVVWPTVEAFVSSLTLQPSQQTLAMAAAAGRSEAKAKSIYGEELEEEGGQRMKDLAVILFILGSLQYRATGSDDLYRQLIADLTSPERLCELRAHPRRTLTALLGLSYLGVYPLPIYDWVLRDDFYEVVQSHLSPEDLLVLQHLIGSIALDLPAYGGPRLNLSKHGSAAEGGSGRRGLTVPSDRSAVLGKESTEECNRRLQALRNVEDILLDVLPPRYDTRLVQLLPHLYSTPDIEIFQVDTPPSAAKKLAVVLCIDNEYFKIYDDASAQRPPRKHLCGRSAVKLRHIAAAGYAVAPVPLHEFDASKDKKAYMKHVIENIISGSR